MRQHPRRKTGAGIRDQQCQRIAFAHRFEAQPLRRSFERVVEHIADHLLESGVEDHRDIVLNAVLIDKRDNRPAGAKILGQVIQERVESGFHGRFAARLACRQQDAADDGLAALQLCLHFTDFLQQIDILAEFGHPSPVAQNDGQGCQRRAQFVRRA